MSDLKYKGPGAYPYFTIGMPINRGVCGHPDINQGCHPYTTCLVHTQSSRKLPMLKGTYKSYVEVRN
jgi:hypothetical protein